ncbi:hypothetical protein NDU88_011956, partial [Pleurodeles waltl]
DSGALLLCWVQWSRLPLQVTVEQSRSAAALAQSVRPVSFSQRTSLSLQLPAGAVRRSLSSLSDLQVSVRETSLLRPRKCPRLLRAPHCHLRLKVSCFQALLLFALFHHSSFLFVTA